MFRFIRAWRNKKRAKKKQEILKDIKRGKAVLKMIDNHLIQSGQKRKQRKRFWKEFIESQNVRNHIYAIIEQSLEGETKYKHKTFLINSRNEV